MGYSIINGFCTKRSRKIFIEYTFLKNGRADIKKKANFRNRKFLEKTNNFRKFLPQNSKNISYALDFKSMLLSKV